MQPSWNMEKDVEDLGEQPATPAGPRDSEPVEVVETDLHFAERSPGSFGMTQQQMSLLLGKRPRKEIAREVVRGCRGIGGGSGGPLSPDPGPAPFITPSGFRLKLAPGFDGMPPAAKMHRKGPHTAASVGAPTSTKLRLKLRDPQSST